MKKTKIISALLLTLLLSGCKQNIKNSDTPSTSNEELIFKPTLVGMYVGFYFEDEHKNKPEYSDFMHEDAFRFIEVDAGNNTEAQPITYAKDHFNLFTHYEVGIKENDVELNRVTRRLELNLTTYFMHSIISIYGVMLNENKSFTTEYITSLSTEVDVLFNVKLEEKLIREDKTGDALIWDLTIKFSDELTSVTFSEMSADDIKLKEYTLLDASVASIIKDPLTSYIVAKEKYLINGEEVIKHEIVKDDTYFYKFGHKGYIPTNNVIKFKLVLRNFKITSKV